MATQAWRHSVLVAVLLLAAASTYSATSYKGFAKLDAKDCVPADDTILSNLPPAWKAYDRFVKVCNLKKAGARSEVSVISVWEQEYFRAVQETGRVPRLESFPLPVLVNKALAVIGNLPEVYPDDDITSSTLYYGKWQLAILTEILVDVENPAEGGDYFYEPIRYDRSLERYEMRNKEILHGRRR